MVLLLLLLLPLQKATAPCGIKLLSSAAEVVPPVILLPMAALSAVERRCVVGLLLLLLQFQLPAPVDAATRPLQLSTTVKGPT